VITIDNEDQNDNKEIDNVEKIMKRLEKITEKMEDNYQKETKQMMESPYRMILLNFIIGLARGLGIAVGATVLGALFLIVLLRLAQLNIPVIGEFLARLIKIVQTYL